MSIKNWHEHDRPREKLIKFGANTLTDAELLAIFLRVGVQGKNAIELAQDLLDHFGNLHNLLTADHKNFCQAKGLGNAKFAQLNAVLEMARRHFESGLKKGDVFNNPELCAQYFNQQIGHSSREQFGCLLLNQQNEMISFEILFQGTLNQAIVYPREIAKHALTNDAAAVIITHNHPSGDPSPSTADKEITKIVHQALMTLDIRLLDHIIVGDHGRWYSLAQHNDF